VAGCVDGLMTVMTAVMIVCLRKRGPKRENSHRSKANDDSLDAAIHTEDDGPK
jgi:hypothetical protein